MAVYSKQDFIHVERIPSARQAQEAALSDYSAKVHCCRSRTIVDKPLTMSMLKKFRRGSKDTITSITSHEPRHDSLATAPATSPQALIPNKPTFFDLPAEVRNEIYDFLANDTILYLPPPTTEKKQDERKKKDYIPPCGLLLTSRQCRKEFLPLLYSSSPVIIDIKDFDFTPLPRVIGSLYSTDLKAFRANKTLILRLRTQNCTRANLDGLRRWLVHRADSLDRLPWRYEVFVSDPIGRMGCFRQSREITFYAERLQRMQGRLEETLQWELVAIVAAFERKSAELDAVLQGVPMHLNPTTRPIRGLSGGGITTV
ncbi:ferrochelatase hem15 [Recurvomyces mirabilis]|nr:ferrochelatase hem15 [Recurvomyces mirabilis]